MWPALLQLIELAPHVTRLVPMADRYLQSRAEGRDTERRAVEHAVDGLRGELALTAERMHEDLARVTVAQAAIVQQLTEQSESLKSIAADLHAARLANDARMTRMETQMSRLWIALLAGLLLIFATGVIVVFAVLHARQSLHGS
jgi:hypothetical protein